MARKDDRRIQRTRKQLRESMLALILDRGYEDISIQDVTDHADLGRATFYLHYREKDDLYRDVLQNMAEDFLDSLPKTDGKCNVEDGSRNLELLFNYIENQYDLYRISFMNGRSARLTSAIVGEIIKENFRIFTTDDMETYVNATGIPFDFLLSYNASTLKSTLFWWLENEMPYSASEMARIYEKVSFYSNFQILRAAKESDNPKLAHLSKALEQVQLQDEMKLELKRDASKKETSKAPKKKEAKDPADTVHEEQKSENDESKATKKKN